MTEYQLQRRPYGEVLCDHPGALHIAGENAVVDLHIGDFFRTGKIPKKEKQAA